MAVLAIVRPHPVVAIGGTFQGAARLITPDPKEAAITPDGGNRTIDVDLGSVQAVDTLFLGYTNGGPGDAITVSYGSGNYSESDGGVIPIAHSDLYTPRRHYLRVYDAPFNARYIRFSGGFPGGYTVGVAAVGLAFRPQYGQEYGSGRPIEDTGTAERLFGGGFGIDEGAIVGGWQWTLGDLQADEVRKLYAIARDRGTTRTLLVVEDPEQTVGLSERVHWGLFRKLDPYERIDPKNTRWGLTVGDWG